MIDSTWYKKHLKQIKNSAGPRYQPDYNVTLPIASIFEGITRKESFYTEIRKKYGELIRHLNCIYPKKEKEVFKDILEEIKNNKDTLFGLINVVKEYSTDHLPWEEIHTYADLLLNSCKKLYKQMYAINIEKRKEHEGLTYSFQSSFSCEINSIYKVISIIDYFKQLSTSSKGALSNTPFLLLKGLAGRGKTHLLCDIAEKQINDQSSIVMCFGRNFNSTEGFWQQMMNHTNLNETFETNNDLLLFLNEQGRENQCRSLLIIDAINENISHSPNFWINNINQIIEEIKQYPHVALIISVRSGFENQLLTQDQQEVFIHEEHIGFHSREWAAVNKFFKEFKLPLPQVPLLIPEFKEPLFLLLFCKAFQKRRNHSKRQAFKGHEGATYIFESYVDSVARPIEEKFNISHSGNNNIWDTIIEKIAEKMVKSFHESIHETELFDIVKIAHPSINTEELIQALEINMLIVKAPHYERNGKVQGFDIYFPYQKFSDHLIGRYIFKQYTEQLKEKKEIQSLETAKKFFSRKTKIGKFISSSWNIGIIEALSVQCPERLKGLELIEVAPYLLKTPCLANISQDAFIASLIWRNTKSFSKDLNNTFQIIKSIAKDKNGNRDLLNAFLSVCSEPCNPFNADFLDKYLSNLTMAERDQKWSMILHDLHGKRKAIDSLLEWSWSHELKTHISDEAIRLTVITLIWFFTSSNRTIRDNSTRGLVCLLENHLYLFPILLEKFKNINDPYVFERLLAVVYGCVLRVKNRINIKDNELQSIKKITEWIYTNIFSEKPPLHILLRDYARGTIEVAIKLEIQIKEMKYLPPYASEWGKVLSKEDIKIKYNPKQFHTDKKRRGFLDLWNGIFEYGLVEKFHETLNYSLQQWLGRELNSTEPTKKITFDSFKKTLSKTQGNLLKEATSFSNNARIKQIIENIQATNKTSPVNKEAATEQIDETETYKEKIKAFKNSLSLQQREIFNNEIEDSIDEFGELKDPYENFNQDMSKCWMFERAINLGYEPNIFDEFDKMIREDRSLLNSTDNVDRIGKKYQWITYHECLGLVADHYQFSDGKYYGPWQVSCRDIDPSFVLKDDSAIHKVFNINEWKNNQGAYNHFQNNADDLDWIKDKDDIPNPIHTIQIIDNEKKEWLMLEGIITWDVETPPEHKKYDIPIREVFYRLKSIIIKKEDKNDIIEAFDPLNDKTLGNDFLDPCDFYDIFIGEFPNGAAFCDTHGKQDWSKVYRDKEIVAARTSCVYKKAFGLDGSYIDNISLTMPSRFLVNEMNLIHKNLDGIFCNQDGSICAFPTNIFEKSEISSLLIDKNILNNFLDTNGYEIIWHLFVEKRIAGGSPSENSIRSLDLRGLYYFNQSKNIIGKLE